MIEDVNQDTTMKFKWILLFSEIILCNTVLTEEKNGNNNKNNDNDNDNNDGNNNTNKTTKDLWLLGLFPFSGSWSGGLGQLPAVEMGLRDVNADPNMLPGYTLHMTINDTAVSIRSH